MAFARLLHADTNASHSSQVMSSQGVHASEWDNLQLAHGNYLKVYSEANSIMHFLSKTMSSKDEMIGQFLEAARHHAEKQCQTKTIQREVFGQHIPKKIVSCSKLASMTITYATSDKTTCVLL